MNEDVLVWHYDDELPPEGTAAILDIREFDNYEFEDYDTHKIIQHFTEETYSCFGMVVDGAWKFVIPEGGEFPTGRYIPEIMEIIRWTEVPFRPYTHCTGKIYDGAQADALAERLKDLPFVMRTEKVVRPS